MDLDLYNHDKVYSNDEKMVQYYADSKSLILAQHHEPHPQNDLCSHDRRLHF